MATRVYTEDELFEFWVAFCQAAPALRNRGLGPRQYLGAKGRALAQLLASVQKGIEDVDRDIVPGAQETVNGVRRARNSTQGLDDWAFDLGLPTNRPGGFGRNGEQAASGGAGVPGGAPGTVVMANTKLVDPTSKVTLECVSGFILPTGAIEIQAITPGEAGNLPVGTKLTWLSPPAGLAALLTLSTGLSGGYEVESDLDLADRIVRWLQSPPHGGTAADLRRWAEEALDDKGRSLGIVRAWVYIHRNGIGSADIVISQGGTGLGRDPGGIKRTAVQTYVDARRIATDTIRVLQPGFPGSREFWARIRCVPNSGFKYDWDDGGTPMIAVGGTGTAVVILGARPPPRLQTAIDNAELPRLQFGFFGPVFAPIPTQIRATAYAANTPMAGQCTLTLESALPQAVAGGDWIFAGGPAVVPVALAALAEVDATGPSKQSGYQDEITDSWRAIVAVSSIARAALDAIGEDGTKVLSYSQAVGEGVGITFNINNLGWTDSDVPLFDNTPPNPPELPFCSFVWVTQ